ncbi:MAG TPA: N-acyl homoserine lactonase family protein [Puia sp.]|jgi:glyoxylase-like metal-dependent hydrolase (beta-lactamase superfamily II)|nr:N-acyl homoserine lactonase family protein [Puia sp.]
MFPAVTIDLTSQGRPIRLHLLSTGAVSVKTRFRQTRFHNFLSIPDFILDPHFTDWLPIWVMLIQHPEGVFLIDAGERATVTRPGYFRSSGLLSGWFDSSQFKFSITRDQEIDRQLPTLGLSSKAITAVVLTHLHFDHTDGLYHFPSTPVYVAKPEWDHPFGALPKLYPAWFRPNLPDLSESIGPFKKAAWLTRSKDLALVHTPGHTYGHCSVLITADTHHILFAADICYSQQQLLAGEFAANAASYRLARQTYEAVKSYAAVSACPLVFLPSHDPGSATRLQHLTPLILPFIPPTT